MARQKLPNNKKKPKIGVTVNKTLLEVMDEYIEELGVNRSKYIENLIRQDMKKRGFDIEPDFKK